MHFYDVFAQKGNGYRRFSAVTIDKIHFYAIIEEKKGGGPMDNAEIRELAANFDISQVINCYSAKLTRARRFYARPRACHALVLFTDGWFQI